jgi:uncharacterized protein (TIGR02246 family)
MSKLKMMKLLYSLALAVPLLGAPPEDAIRKVMNDQVEAWNHGDVQAFMDGYSDSDTLTFVGAVITKGHAQVLANYQKRYPTKDNMGTLDFSGLEIRMLGQDYASVIGHWHLVRKKEAGGEVGGYFTLLFQNTQAGWRIILDHTS